MPSGPWATCRGAWHRLDVFGPSVDVNIPTVNPVTHTYSLPAAADREMMGCTAPRRRSGTHACWDASGCRCTPGRVVQSIASPFSPT
nr:hypothetical protein CFP56_12182 [Quercus suber]